jgi:hypothetical protein
VAGSDTTATAIRVTFLHVISSPYIYSTLRKEIDNASPLSSPITDAEAKRLPYLQAVIEEGLRYWPPIGLLASKIVPKGGATINGFFLPEDSSIGVSTMGIQRSKEIFGPDADEFRPERWLSFGEGEAEKAREKRMRSTVDLVFASGKYTCPGRPVAMMELNKIFVEVCNFSQNYVLFICQFLAGLTQVRCHPGESFSAVEVGLCWGLDAKGLARPYLQAGAVTGPLEWFGLHGHDWWWWNACQLVSCRTLALS